MSEGRYFYKRGSGYLLEIGKNWGIGIALCQFHENVSLQIMPIFGNIFIQLPRRFHREVRIGEIMAAYGFTWRWGRGDWGRDIHFNWGYYTKILHMPWDYTFIRHDIYMANGKWKRVQRGESPWNWTDKWQETHPYKYTLKGGTVQLRSVNIGIEEREWRQKWLRWCPWFAKISRTIEIEFNQEVGERSGSWKGGCIGCSYELRKDETPLECLRRMETDRKL